MPCVAPPDAATVLFLTVTFSVPSTGSAPARTAMQLPSVALTLLFSIFQLRVGTLLVYPPVTPIPPAMPRAPMDAAGWLGVTVLLLVVELTTASPKTLCEMALPTVFVTLLPVTLKFAVTVSLALNRMPCVPMRLAAL